VFGLNALGAAHALSCIKAWLASREVQSISFGAH
jgi:hypothetical protein